MRTRAKWKFAPNGTALGARVPLAELFVPTVLNDLADQVNKFLRLFQMGQMDCIFYQVNLKPMIAKDVLIQSFCNGVLHRTADEIYRYFYRF